MKQHIPFGDTPNFKSIVHDMKKSAVYDYQVANKCEYVEGDPLVMPTIRFFGTEKIHGTNASVCYNHADGLWAQAKNRIIEIGDDNYGCAAAVMAQQDVWLELMLSLANEQNIDLDIHTLTIYFEWAGGNIQGDNSAVSGLDKSAFIFSHARVSMGDVHIKWISTVDAQASKHGIYNLTDYDMYTITLDFNDLDACVATLDDITLNVVEPKSPVGTAFNLDNVGEGVYYIALVNGELIRFKHKGLLHGGKPKQPKVRTPMDSDRIVFLIDLAAELIPVWRITQAIKETNATTMKDIGNVFKWIHQDILKEETVILADANTDYKDVQKFVVASVKEYYVDHIGGN